MVQIVNHIVPVTVMVMAIVQPEVMGVNVTLDGKDGDAMRSVTVENTDMIVPTSRKIQKIILFNFVLLLSDVCSLNGNGECSNVNGSCICNEVYVLDTYNCVNIKSNTLGMDRYCL